MHVKFGLNISKIVNCLFADVFRIKDGDVYTDATKT